LVGAAKLGGKNKMFSLLQLVFFFIFAILNFAAEPEYKADVQPEKVKLEGRLIFCGGPFYRPQGGIKA
jgi:hypothetical protein